MSPAEFESNKRGLITRILQRDDRLQTRSDHYWRELDLGYYKFDTRMQIADAVRHLTLKDFKAFFRQSIDGRARKELVVANVGTNRAAEFAAKKMPSDTVIIAHPEMFGSKLPFFTASRSAAGVASQRADASDCTVSAQSC
jgi:secreted Zn-dependent insulinase-like peptidase